MKTKIALLVCLLCVGLILIRKEYSNYKIVSVQLDKVKIENLNKDNLYLLRLNIEYCNGKYVLWGGSVQPGINGIVDSFALTLDFPNNNKTKNCLLGIDPGYTYLIGKGEEILNHSNSIEDVKFGDDERQNVWLFESCVPLEDCRLIYSTK